MSPPARARPLSKAAFSPTFSKLKTSIYTDSLRPSAPVSSAHFIRTLSWNAPGTLIATGAADRTLRIWNPEKTNVKNSTELRGHTGGVERVAFHPVNETELASCSSDGMVRFWDVRSKAVVGEVKVGGEPFTLAWTPDGSEIVAGRKDNNLIPISRSTLTTITEHHQPVQTNQCVFTWDGSAIFLTNGDGCVKILRYPSFEHFYTLNAHTSSCYALSISPSGGYLAIGGGDALVSLWDTQEWMCVRTLDKIEGPVKSVDFSFDGSYVVGGSDEDNKLHIAHTETGEYVYTIDTIHPAAYVAWHPCRYVLAYSAEAQGLKIRSTMDVQAPLNPSTLFSVRGLLVVITGGGTSIGLAIASALHQNGASKIYLLGRRIATLEKAVETLKSSSSAPHYVDVLINNAGVIGPRNGIELHESESISQLRGAMLKDWSGWESTMAINTQSVFGVSAAFLPLLEAENIRRHWQGSKVTGYGNARHHSASALEKIGTDADDSRLAHIITVASIASYIRRCAAGLVDNASKGAAAHIGNMLSTLLAEWGIRSNVGRPWNENNIGGLILFLVGNGGTYISGTVQVSDGGRLGVFPSMY
ncbi:WD40 repeat-like protein [Zopfia rhizophila CBS 207.26]|uniref:WD40 repeat-like protein n=1 Tax=Zopfia rhizophila CBS 207.26 TaxID=1314779 RepID=A0A6A6EDW9_9PEZI|nr:WD40 repeat-like protein [Zopfia rhizophila CBS 207.26]